MDITVVTTTADNNEDAFALLSALGFPFKASKTSSRLLQAACS